MDASHALNLPVAFSHPQHSGNFLPAYHETYHQEIVEPGDMLRHCRHILKTSRLAALNVLYNYGPSAR